jgi:hypothetical protein
VSLTGMLYICESRSLRGQCVWHIDAPSLFCFLAAIFHAIRKRPPFYTSEWVSTMSDLKVLTCQRPRLACAPAIVVPLFCNLNLVLVTTHDPDLSARRSTMSYNSRHNHQKQSAQLYICKITTEHPQFAPACWHG